MAWQSWFYAQRPAAIPKGLAHPVGTVAVTAFVLGALAGVCAMGVWSLVRGIVHRQASTSLIAPMQTYVVAWSCFHVLEFVVTAYWNATHLLSDSFLLQNGFEYVAAHAFGVLEYVLECWLVPQTWWKRLWYVQALGLALVIAGQLLRSFAMIHASTNFSHALAQTKREDHVLITSGVYALARHPSYAGFFWWALGTQIVLGNPVSVFLFTVLLTRFFANRIHGTCPHTHTHSRTHSLQSKNSRCAPSLVMRTQRMHSARRAACRS